ncbi:hypothetical protein PILCRDRAFT_1730 [Piloderma croceum F 1598]|uniref:Uncharacterized protein n=1 Tax=Piloderma croceum (strain F 1598) TaxID=765440 RepID=A0A0C3CL96_PILCF|nr:hypothetical protein PILCRDRAFT_1730 [Piloderma croceum F 1598]
MFSLDKSAKLEKSANIGASGPSDGARRAKVRRDKIRGEKNEAGLLEWGANDYGNLFDGAQGRQEVVMSLKIHDFLVAVQKIASRNSLLLHLNYNIYDTVNPSMFHRGARAHLGEMGPRHTTSVTLVARDDRFGTQAFTLVVGLYTYDFKGHSRDTDSPRNISQCRARKWSLVHSHASRGYIPSTSITYVICSAVRDLTRTFLTAYMNYIAIRGPSEVAQASSREPTCPYRRAKGAQTTLTKFEQDKGED